MRSQSQLIKILLNEAQIHKLPELSIDNKVTVVVVDAMHCIHRWSFVTGEHSEMFQIDINCTSCQIVLQVQ